MPTPSSSRRSAPRAAQLRREGVPERERSEAANLVLTAWSAPLRRAGRWILDAGHREAHSELA